MSWRDALDWKEIGDKFHEAAEKGINPFSTFNAHQRETMMAYLSQYPEVVPPEQGNFPDCLYLVGVDIAEEESFSVRVPVDHYPTLAERLAESMKDDK